MIVTWFLADHYSLPADATIALGLLGAVFVILFDLFLLFFLAGAKLREGSIAAAIKQGVLLLGLGLLIAPVVGVLPWCLRWVMNSSPWVPLLLRVVQVVVLAVWMIVALVQVRKLPPGKGRYAPLNFPVLWAYMIIASDASVPSLLKLVLVLTIIAGLIWRALVHWRQRRAASATGSA
jgi:hypothetical protein